MKPYIIRKQDCGHYSIFKVENTFDLPIDIYSYMFIRNFDFMVREVAHLETFSDVLVLLNVGVMGDGKY